MTEAELLQIEERSARHSGERMRLLLRGPGVVSMGPLAGACERSALDVPELVAEVRRLRALIAQAEWTAGRGYGPYEADPDGACPWCDGHRAMTSGQVGHRADCPAFPPEPKR